MEMLLDLPVCSLVALFDEVTIQEAEQMMATAAVTQIAAQGSGTDLQKAMRPLDAVVKKHRSSDKDAEKDAFRDLRRLMADNDKWRS